MFTVDIHTHILPKNWENLNKKYGDTRFLQIEHENSSCAKLIQNGKCFRKIQANCWDPKIRIQECDQNGVDLQVLSTVPVMFSYWAKPEHAHDLAHYLNDEIAKVVSENPKRFVGLGTLPMQSPRLAIQELTRCKKELGLVGIEVGSHVNGRNLDEDYLFPIFEAAQELNMAVFVHPWDMLGKDRMQNYWLPWLVGMPAELSIAISSMIFGGVFERLPRLRVVFAHGGGSFPSLLGRLERGFQVRPDLCATRNNLPPRKYVGKFYVDSLVHDPHMFQFLVQTLGENSIALGTDYPFPLGEAEPGKLIQSTTSITQKQKQRMLSGTAMEWLNLKESDFAH